MRWYLNTFFEIMERKWNIGTPMEQIQPFTIGYNQLLLRSIFFIDEIATNRINKRKARYLAIWQPCFLK